MGMPTGAVVARPMVVRACGCACEFQHIAGDRYRDQRLAKFRATRCAACAAQAEAARQREEAERPAGAAALRGLPAGTRFSVVKVEGGSWAGTLTAGGVTCQSAAGGLDELTWALARAWLTADGARAGPGRTPGEPVRG